MNVEERAKEANSVSRWHELWGAEGTDTWRKDALSEIYDRISQLAPRGKDVVDLGGGVGILAKKLQDEKDCKVAVVEHNDAAIHKAREQGLTAVFGDLEGGRTPYDEVDVVVATEVLEHLSQVARDRVLSYAAQCGKGFFSVPNDCLGPEVEPQHTIQFTARTFKEELLRFFKDVRVECHGRYLLGVCGFPKKFTLALTLPVRDEGADLERVIQSFYGAVDEIVIGVDPRTVDNTWDIASKYTDDVFYLEEPTKGPDGEVPDKGVHFAWIRNQCMDRCKSDWIFMTEGHEHLAEGLDALLGLDQIPHFAKAAFVRRSGGNQGENGWKWEEWVFPWLTRNLPEIRYKRSTHNIVSWPEGTTVVQLHQIRTLHDRVHDRALARVAQRSVQNRKELMEDWLVEDNAVSLLYLGSEWRGINDDKAIARLEEFLALPRNKNGPGRYHSRLLLAKLYWGKKDVKAAREVLMGCAGDDWSRTDHWIWLGDIAFTVDEDPRQALQFYKYAATNIGERPMTLWWVNVASYSYLPAMRLAMTHAELGQYKEALYWAQRVKEQFPKGVPDAMIEEANKNIELLQEAIDEAAA